MHEYYEMSIEKVCALSKEEFLDLCAAYLEAALEDDRRRSVERQAQVYARFIGLYIDELEAIW